VHLPKVSVHTALVLLLLSSAASAMAQSSTSGADAQLQSICQELLDAVAAGHADVWRKYLHDRVIHVDETGAVRDKEELLKLFEPLPPGLVGSAKIDRFKSVKHGNVAVAAYEIQEHLDYHGQVLRSRFRVSDTWLKTAAGWRLLSEQVSAVLKDPPAIELTQQQLCGYNGSYALTESITATITCAPAGLTVVRAGREPLIYLPEVYDVFFVPGQPRTRRIFERDPQGRVSGFVDRREGEDVRWIRRN
jgi:regulator of sigma D